LIEKLAFCVDPTDRELYGVSQLIHTIQVLDAMEKDGIKDEYFLLAGLFHDIGKILLLTDELPENIVCDNGVVGSYSEGVGLDQCIQHWNHDEFAYNRLKNYLPYPMTWLIRYHSLKITEEIKRYMNHSDKDLADKYYARFKNYDKLTKSIFHIPKIDIEKYRRLTEKLLPNFIEI
jgi:predicted HD phosphohydrolase